MSGARKIDVSDKEMGIKAMDKRRSQMARSVQSKNANFAQVKVRRMEERIVFAEERITNLENMISELLEEKKGRSKKTKSLKSLK